MFHYVTDKVFLKESYSVCADTVNQLVQKLKSYGIQSSMSVVVQILLERYAYSEIVGTFILI